MCFHRLVEIKDKASHDYDVPLGDTVSAGEDGSISFSASYTALPTDVHALREAYEATGRVVPVRFLSE